MKKGKCEYCEDKALRYKDPITGLWYHEKHSRERGPYDDTVLCTRSSLP